MGYVEKNLSSGEEILDEQHPTLTPFKIQAMTFSILTLGLALIIVVPAYVIVKIGNSFAEIVVTNRRVVRKTGVLSRKTDEFLIRQIESIEVRQTVLGRMFGYGSVLVHGTGGDPMVLLVDQPSELKKTIDEAIFATPPKWTR